MAMFNSSGQPVNMEALINLVTSVSGTSGVLMVSSLTAAGSTTAISANQSLSAVLLAGTANIGYVSAFVDNGSVSAKSGDASNLRVSGFSPDAGTFRVSALGGTAGDILVDGSDNTISARIKQISAVLSASDNALIVQAVSEGAGRMQVSAKSGDAGLLLVSTKQGDAGLHLVSAKQGDAALFRTSALNQDANFMHVSGFSPDAGLFLVSGKQGDAGLLLVSAKSGTATQMIVSATQGDGALLRVSSLDSAVTTSTGGLSFFSTSAGIAQVSTVKSSAGRLYGWYLGNPAGVDQYLQIFNTSGGATLGTDVPTMTLYVPTLGAANVILTPGIGMGTGIQIGVTSTAAGNTAGASGMRTQVFYA